MLISDAKQTGAVGKSEDRCKAILGLIHGFSLINIIHGHPIAVHDSNIGDRGDGSHCHISLWITPLPTPVILSICLTDIPA